MSKKISLLIISSILGLIALSLTQAYLFKNTYTQKKVTFLNKANQAVSRIDDYTPAIDSINDTWQRLFVKELDEYSLKLISNQEVLNRLRHITDSLNSSFKREYDKELVTKKLEYNLKFHKIVKNIILVDSTKIDTLFKEDSKRFYRLLGYDFEHTEDSKISNSVWQTERSFKRTINGVSKNVAYQLYFETQDHINIDGWRKIVLRSMSTLLVLSVLIFTFVIGILYYSIQSLIRQKKIADIKTDFINNITHELKTPLATLTLATKMLRKNEVKNDLSTMETTVSTIERQNKRLQKLIDQVLNNSLGYKEIELQKETVQTKGYINTLLDDFILSLDSNTIVIERFNLDENHRISIDKFYLSTAFLNILENAVKYGGTKIKVDTKRMNNNELCISFKDNGKGISKENQKLLFNKFFRVDNNSVHNVKGLGLGLYYSNQIIKAHKGTISIDSIVGEGSTFTIILPME